MCVLLEFWHLLQSFFIKANDFSQCFSVQCVWHCSGLLGASVCLLTRLSFVWLYRRLPSYLFIAGVCGHWSCVPVAAGEKVVPAIVVFSLAVAKHVPRCDGDAGHSWNVFCLNCATSELSWLNRLLENERETDKQRNRGKSSGLEQHLALMKAFGPKCQPFT